MPQSFYAQGGNFIDTANGYQNGESEQWVGHWMEARGVRDEIVLMTKFTNQFMGHFANGKSVQLSNFGGNGTKSLHTSFEASLKKLKTSYVDIVRTLLATLFRKRPILTAGSALRPPLGLLVEQ